MHGDFIYGTDVYMDEQYFDEDWEYIRGFPDYSISNYARVWSTFSNWFLTPVAMGKHWGVHLWVNNRSHSRYIHRLVAEAFLPNPDGFPVVRHLDDDPSYNTVDNLRWGTQKENLAEAIENGRLVGGPVPVRAIRLFDGYAKDFWSMTDASNEVGVTVSGISRIADTNNTMNGYRFERLR